MLKNQEKNFLVKNQTKKTLVKNQKKKTLVKNQKKMCHKSKKFVSKIKTNFGQKSKKKFFWSKILLNFYTLVIPFIILKTKKFGHQNAKFVIL